MNLAPIVLFVYNRPWHTARTIEALQDNHLAKESELYVYSDASKCDSDEMEVREVRRIIRKIEGFKKISIIEREKNYGLANSIIAGVTNIVTENGKIIVLEDDLVTSRNFLMFMNKGLTVYETRSDIVSVTGFNFRSSFMNYPKNYEGNVFLNIRPMSWSWATWKDRWKHVDWELHDYEKFISSKKEIRSLCRGGTDLVGMLKLQVDGVIDSWYIRWAFHAYRHNLYTIYPRISHVNNIGHDGTGAHCGIDEDNFYGHNELSSDEEFFMNRDIRMNPIIVRSFNRAFNIRLRSRVKKLAKSILGLDT